MLASRLFCRLFALRDAAFLKKGFDSVGFSALS